jgi:hypothetical protein
MEFVPAGESLAGSPMDARFLGEVAGSGRVVCFGSIHAILDHLTEKTGDARVLFRGLDASPTSRFILQCYCDVFEFA